jgi:hypothetical protein
MADCVLVFLSKFHSCPEVFAAGDHSVASTFGHGQRRMLRIIQCFGRCCSCHLQGGSVEVGHFWKPYMGQALGGELNSMVLNWRFHSKASLFDSKKLHRRYMRKHVQNIFGFQTK